MLDTREKLNQALKHFPRWMDIRKRELRSKGGQYLFSILQELDPIGEKMLQRKEEFHIEYYQEHADEIVDYLYVAVIGDVDPEELELTEPRLELTNVLRYFRENEGVACYPFELDTGRLALHEKDVLKEDGDPKEHIRYKIGDSEYSAPIERVHVWNAIDEFALFSGLERFPGERNKELVNRILQQYRRPPNSTLKELQNAVANAVINHEEIYPEQVYIETPDEQNVNEEIDGEKIIDRLAEVNKDLMRAKRWDKDLWDHDFVDIEHLPVDWDVSIDMVQDGTGTEDNLKTFLARESKNIGSTDVTVHVYEQTEAAIERYVQRHNIYGELEDIRLERHTESLQPEEIEYRIDAYEVCNLTDFGTELQIERKYRGESLYYISDILLNPGEVEHLRHRRGKLDPGMSYTLEFRPPSGDAAEQITIEKCDLYDPHQQDLLTDSKPYKRDFEGAVSNSKVQFCHTSTEGAVGHDNVRNTLEGIALDDLSRAGEVVFDISGLKRVNNAYPRLYVGHSCPFSPVGQDNPFLETGDEMKAEPDEYDSLDEEKIEEVEALQEKTLLILGDDDRQDKSSPAGLEGDKSGHMIAYCPENNRWGDLGEFEAGRYFFARRPHSYQEDFLKLSDGFQAGEVAFDIKSGQCTVAYTVDGQPAEEKTLSAGEHFELSFASPKEIELEIQRSGDTPFVLKDLRYTRYRVTAQIGSAESFDVEREKRLTATSGETLTLNVESFTGRRPVIEFLSVISGTMDEDNFYRLEFETSSGSQEPYLDIETDARVFLNGEEIEFKPYFEGEEVSKELKFDLSHYDTIESSQPELRFMAEDGHTIPYLILDPGETLDRVKVKGEHKTRTRSVFLSDLFEEQEIYGTTAYQDFIVQDGTEQKKRPLRRNDIDPKASVIRVADRPDKTSVSFVVSGKEYIQDSFEGYFEKLYIFPSGAELPSRYVAYDSRVLFAPRKSDIEIPYSFTPFLDPGKMMLYKLHPPEDSKMQVQFQDREQKDWSLGRTPIEIVVDKDMGSPDEYDLEVGRIDERFRLGTVIELPRELEIDGEEQDLAAFIIKPEQGIELEYRDEAGIFEEEFYVTEAGFTKLEYSNIEEVFFVQSQGQNIESYRLLPQEGILVWEDEELVGESVTVQYEYKIPEKLVYTDLSILYDRIEHTIEAYQEAEGSPVVFENITEDGTSNILDLAEQGLYVDDSTTVLVQIEDPAFSYERRGGIITVYHALEEDEIGVFPGFYYKDGREHYHHGVPEDDVITHFDGIQMINVSRIGAALKMRRESANYLLDTDMAPTALSGVSYIDFQTTRRDADELGFSEITALDGFNHWHTANMETALVQGYRERAVEFSPLEQQAYAFLNITGYIKDGLKVLLHKEGEIQVYIAKEKRAPKKMDYTGSMLLEKIALVEEKNGLCYHVFEDIEPDGRYFLLVEGEGLLSDVMFVPADESETVYERNIDRLDFGITEEIEKDQTRRIVFDRYRNKPDGVEMDEKGTMRTSSSISWGLTRIHSGRKSWLEYSTENVTVQGDMLRSADAPGKVITPPIRIRDLSYALGICAKVNDVEINGFDGFSLRLLAGSEPDRVLSEIDSVQQSNTISVMNPAYLQEYIRLEIEVPIWSFIRDVELFVPYREGVPVRRRSRGELVTKVYDAGDQKTYRLSRVDFGQIEEPQSVEIDIRGARTMDGRTVYTEWRNIEFTESGEVENQQGLEFEDYGFFQLRVRLTSPDARLAIDSFDLLAN